MARRRAAARVRLGPAQVDLPPQPHRPGRAALLAADRRRPEPARGRPAVVHDDVRTRQHLHQPAGAAVRARARRHDAAGARATGRAAASTTSATRTPAGSSTRCATARWPRSRSGRTRRTTASADATPLYVVLLDEYERWTGDRKLVRELEYEARAALHWIDDYADLHGQRLHLVQAPQRADRPGEPVLEGLVELDLVQRRPAARLPAGDVRAPGLRLRREDARRAAGPPRLEGPGLRRHARAGGRRAQAALQPRLLDRGRRLLRARARRRRQPGRRARLEHRPPPVERHRRRSRRRRRSSGTSWARGCSPAGASAPWPRARAGTTRSATTSARSGRSTTRSSPGACGGTATRRRPRASRPDILDAAEIFEGRLPEAFGGYDRAVTKFPVQYPTACSPQAWSTGAPLLLLRTMLGLEPIGEHLIVDPALPRSIGHLELLDIPGRWGRIDAFARGRLEMDGHRRSKKTAKPSAARKRRPG